MKIVANNTFIKLIMAFAMFWLFIGDLITLHQSRIFGHDFYGHHQPLNKPGKTDEGKTLHKYHKSVDKSDDGSAYFLWKNSDAFLSLCLSWSVKLVRWFNFNPNDVDYLSGNGLRAPPGLV